MSDPDMNEIRPRPDYSDKPTIVISYTSDDGGNEPTLHAEGFTLPDNLRIVVRDYSIGNRFDEDGLLYEDTEQ